MGWLSVNRLLLLSETDETITDKKYGEETQRKTGDTWSWVTALRADFVFECTV